MKTLNIKAHFEEEKKKLQELVANARSEIEKIQKDTALKDKEKSGLESEKKKLEKLLHQNQEAGLNVAELRDKIKALDSQMASIARDVELLQTKKNEFEEIANRSYGRQDQMLSILDLYHCSEAVVVNSVVECFSVFSVAVVKVDAAGHPLKCNISFEKSHTNVRGAGNIQELSIEPSQKYFCKQFRPQCLAWVPIFNEVNQQKQPKEDEQKVKVFFESKSQKIILPSPLRWTTKVNVSRRSASSYRDEMVEEARTCEDKFDDVAISLESILDASIQSAGGKLDLDEAYPNNSLMAYLRNEVVSQLDTKPTFKKNDEHLPSDEIYKRIQNDWDAFVKCPWSNEIVGTLALLKYHAENGERVRFWSGDYENQYGFRLRTRDHDWIVGGIFIDVSKKPAPAKTPVNIYSETRHYPTQVASLGRLFLHVARDRSERER